MTWQTDIKNNQTTLLLVKSAGYAKMSLDVAKKFSGKKVCYVTLNKTVGAVKESFKKKKVDTKNFFFVDAISNTISASTPKATDCHFVSSPGSLSELSLAITKALAKGYETVIFDSLTNLLIYEGKSPVAKFVSTVVNKIRTTSAKGVFYALEMNQHQEMIQETQMFVDAVSKFK